MTVSYSPSRVRRSIRELERDFYERGNKEPLRKLMRAWRGLKAANHLLPNGFPNVNSFFYIACIHGAPFRGAGHSTADYWGGFCPHGNIQFPVWHRAYIQALEDALRFHEPGVAMAFWDESDEDPYEHKVPRSFTDKTFEFEDGKFEPNPLLEYTLPARVGDTTPGGRFDFTKRKGYTTKRYPYSGLDANPLQQELSAKHNSQFDHDTAVKYLNKNVKNWLNTTVGYPGPTSGLIRHEILKSLKNSDYTTFSNVESLSQWHSDNVGEKRGCLEAAHNYMHLALGGFTLPTHLEDPSTQPVTKPPRAVPKPPKPTPKPPKPVSVEPEKTPNTPPDWYVVNSNGDMGCNETSSFDPIFHFHHCYIDYVFYAWQRIHNKLDYVGKIPLFYPGTNTTGKEQGPSAGFGPNVQLDISSPLHPFANPLTGTWYSGHDVLNLHHLDATYDACASLQKYIDGAPIPDVVASQGLEEKEIEVDGINRAQIHGSYIISLFGKINGRKVLIDSKSVLSRWEVSGCANCQTHLTTRYHFFVPKEATDLSVVVETHDEQDADIDVPDHKDARAAFGAAASAAIGAISNAISNARAAKLEKAKANPGFKNCALRFL